MTYILLLGWVYLVEVLARGVSLILVGAPDFLLASLQVCTKFVDFVTHFYGLLEYLLAGGLTRSLVHNLLHVGLVAFSLSAHEPIQLVLYRLEFVNHQILVSFDI